MVTPEPLDVNINVKLDVYQYTREDQKPGDRATEEAVVEAAASPAVVDATVTAEQRQAAEAGIRNRMEEIQNLKNNRVIGENREGLVEIREIPPGEYGAYAEKTVLAENADRQVIMRALAQEENQAVAAVQREQAQLRARASFKGEWVEEQETDGTWRWVRKASDP